MKPNLLFIDVDHCLFDIYEGSLSGQFNISYLDSLGNNISSSLTQAPDIIIFEITKIRKDRAIRFLKQIQIKDKFLPVLVLTDETNVSLAAETLKYGAFNFLPKKSTPSELRLQIDSLLNLRTLLSRAYYLELQDEKKFEKIVGFSREIDNILSTIKAYAKNDDPVIILGEKGTGKEALARQLHKSSRRSGKPFIPIDCSTIPGELLEIELFGHEKLGPNFFITKKPGKLELADGGTIFLDEISALDSRSQQRLLRFITEGKFERVEGKSEIRSNVRIISSSAYDMEEALNAGLIRQDLYYLIDILPIHVPPLRDRIEDIPYLMEHFAQKVSNELNIPYQGFSERSTSIFLDYEWPGNIRELQSYVTSAVINAEGRLIEPEDVTSSLILKEIFDEFNPGKIPDSWEEMEQMKRDAAYRASRRIEKLFLEHLINHNLLSSKPPFKKSKAS